jgi:hypothetical protein
MSDRAPYSRVYWTVIDDPKFDGIYEDDAAFALWMRLLINADALWPAPAPLHRIVKPKALAKLVDAGIVDLLPRDRYRIHGLDAERGRRRDAARTPPKGDPDGPQTGGKREANGSPARALAETSREETNNSQDEHSIAREGLPNLDQGAIRALEHRTGRTWGQAGEKQLTEYDRLIEDHGIEKVLSAMDRLMTDGHPMTARQLVWGAMKVLEPMVPVQALLKEDADAERQEERDRNSRRGVEATQRYLRELRGESA